MKKIKLKPYEKAILDQARANIATFLNGIKLKPLEGEALRDMKILEDSVVNLECFLLGK